MQRAFLTSALLFGSLLILGCGSGTGDAPDPLGSQEQPIEPLTGKGPIRVVCTTGMIADIAENLGGKHVEVQALMGPGVDPHLYESTPDDADKIELAHVIFYSGLHLESPSMSETLRNLGAEKPSIAVSRDLKEDDLIKEGGIVDPHFWHDVVLWKQAAHKVHDVLAKLKPDLKDDFKKNLDDYLRRMDDLHAHAEKRMKEIPEGQRWLVTAHDAFSYFAQRYGLKVKSVQGVSTTGTAGVGKINELVDFLVKNKIKAIFVESSVPEDNIKALQEGAQAGGHSVRIGGTLYSDALGPKGSGGETYEGMIRHNVDTIVDALK